MKTQTLLANPIAWMFFGIFCGLNVQAADLSVSNQRGLHEHLKGVTGFIGPEAALPGGPIENWSVSARMGAWQVFSGSGAMAQIATNSMGQVLEVPYGNSNGWGFA